MHNKTVKHQHSEVKQTMLQTNRRSRTSWVIKLYYSSTKPNPSPTVVVTAAAVRYFSMSVFGASLDERQSVSDDGIIVVSTVLLLLLRTLLMPYAARSLGTVNHVQPSVWYVPHTPTCSLLSWQTFAPRTADRTSVHSREFKPTPYCCCQSVKYALT